MTQVHGAMPFATPESYASECSVARGAARVPREYVIYMRASFSGRGVRRLARQLTQKVT
jgi:hypothetical protein